MANKSAQALQKVDPLKARIITIVVNAVCVLAIVTFKQCIPIFVIVGSGDDCDEPINTWLLVEGLLGIWGLIVTILEFVFWKTNQSQNCQKNFKYATTPINCFALAWFIAGNVWLFGDDSCEDDWEEGYQLALALIIITYVFIGLACCCLLCLCLCLGKLAGSAQNMKEEDLRAAQGQLFQMQKDLEQQMQASQKQDHNREANFQASVEVPQFQVQAPEVQVEGGAGVEVQGEHSHKKHKHRHRHREQEGIELGLDIGGGVEGGVEFEGEGRTHKERHRKHKSSSSSSSEKDRV